MEGFDLVIAGGFVVIFALISARLSKIFISAPMIFVGFGLLVGPKILDVVELNLEHGFVHILAEITLIIVLYSDASRIDLGVLKRNVGMPLRLLGLGLPLTIGLGILVGYFLFDEIGIWGVAILAAILAPTDAALGQAVVSNERIPIRIRQALNVESGLNDGIAVPFLTVFIAAAGISGGLTSFTLQEVESGALTGTIFTLEQIGFGIIVGVVGGYTAASLMDISSRHGWMSPAFENIGMFAIPIVAFFFAEAVGGNGLIAAFMAGLTTGNVIRHVCLKFLDYSEEQADLLVLVTFMIFGGAFVGATLEDLTWEIVAYALLSLTVVRILPVSLALIGTGFHPKTMFFMGWFGPRGLASFVFALQVVDRPDIAHAEEIFTIVVWTVLFSVVLHGITALPGVNWYGAHAEGISNQPEKPELAEVETLPIRNQRHTKQ
jgi:NhaP-type Na+/H+ or K+/H+ antiporter